jgi:hypothetical protein
VFEVHRVILLLDVGGYRWQGLLVDDLGVAVDDGEPAIAVTIPGRL